MKRAVRWVLLTSLISTVGLLAASSTVPARRALKGSTEVAVQQSGGASIRAVALTRPGPLDSTEVTRLRIYRNGVRLVNRRPSRLCRTCPIDAGASGNRFIHIRQLDSTP